VEPVYTASSFYKNSSPNHYSRIIHANMVDGKAYGFAYDDVGHFESLVNDGDPQQAGIIMSPFGAGGPQPPTQPTNPPATTRPPTQPTNPPATTRPPTQPTNPPATTRPPTQPPAGNTWAAYQSYTVGQVVTYNGVRYTCRQSHVAYPGWEPPNVLALWLPA
jgi:hypothetical protein